MRISALEELLRSKTAEHQGQVDENMKSQHNRLMMVQEKQRLQARCLDLKQRKLVAIGTGHEQPPRYPKTT